MIDSLAHDELLLCDLDADDNELAELEELLLVKLDDELKLLDTLLD